MHLRKRQTAAGLRHPLASSSPGAGASVICERVSRRYEDSEILRDVRCTIQSGELIAVTGRSGSGKTTSWQLIGSLDRPTSGRVLVDGVSVGELRQPAQFRRYTVGFVFQCSVRYGRGHDRDRCVA
jgi:putative ABC transport system ATP-binding protein